ncbi:MAG: Flp family type IVb pilin [Mesorhizobium sp.]
MILRFLRDTAGATAIEYGLMAVLVALGMLMGATALGSQVTAMFDNNAQRVEGAIQPTVP